jgi:tetratricopeptide (TPR) repeat protein
MNKKWVLMMAASLALAAQQQQQPNLGQRGIVRESRAGRKVATPQDVPRGFALLIGVSKYPKLDEANNKLLFPEKDAEALHDALISQSGGNFSPQNVRMLTGAKATLANIRNELAWLARETRDGDRVVIYFAGHGFLDKAKGYLAPVDTDLSQLSQTALPTDELGQVFTSKIAARWKVLLTDACHSGAITPETSNEALNAKISDAPKNVLSFTASRKQESSYEDPNLGGGHGLFTYFLVKALEGQADRDQDGVVNADELIDYVRTHVHEYATQRSKFQTPTEAGDFDPELIFAFNPKNAGGGEAIQSTEGSLVIESNMEDVEFFLDDKPMGGVSPGKPLRLPGVAPGPHTVRGVKRGYDPDQKQILVYPGVETPVTLRILYKRSPKKAAKDLFDDGLKAYNIGTEPAIKNAVEFFSKALAADPGYAEAALYLGRAAQVQLDFEKARKYLELALKLDADYLEAHVALGSVLLDTGDTDEAIRNFRYAVSRDPRDSLARSHLAEAYRMAGAYDRAIEEARAALKVDPNNAQALLWLGDSLRAQKQYAEARDAYRDYVRLTNFDSTPAEKIGFYLLGNPFTNAFSKKRPTQRQVYNDQRNIGFFGLCNSEHRLGNLVRAQAYCRRALEYDPADSYSLMELGRVCVEIYMANRANREPLLTARQNFEKVVSLYGDTAEADQARKYVGIIATELKKQP